MTVQPVIEIIQEGPLRIVEVLHVDPTRPGQYIIPSDLSGSIGILPLNGERQFHNTIANTSYGFGGFSDGNFVILYLSGVGARTWPAGVKWAGGAGAPADPTVGQVLVVEISRVNGALYGRATAYS